MNKTKTIKLNQEEFETLKSVLEFLIYNPAPLYKGGLAEAKIMETILWKKMKVPEFCLIRNQYIYHDSESEPDPKM